MLNVILVYGCSVDFLFHRFRVRFELEEKKREKSDFK
jgi:hypothetical protein